MARSTGRLFLALALLGQPVLAREIRLNRGIAMPGPITAAAARSPLALIPGIPSVADVGVAPNAVLTQALPQLSAAAQPASLAPAGNSMPGAAAFDGSDLWNGLDFEPPSSQRRQAPLGVDEELQGSLSGSATNSERPELGGFPVGARSALQAIDPAKAIYATVKVIREYEYSARHKNNGSRKYWEAYKKGMEVDVIVKGENVFGRPTKITYAVTKKIGALTREDFRGLVPAYQLALPIRVLRQKLIERLDESRRTWHRDDPAVSLQTSVRLIKFKSYLDLYKEVHGKNAVPQPEPQAQRAPLSLKARGRLEVLSRFLPRAVFLDVDMLEGSLSKEILADINELQRTGVYFVAFSRKPFHAKGGLHEALMRNMPGSQLSGQMTYRFLAVTDDGAVISEIRKDGAIAPVDVAAFGPAEIDLLRHAAQRAFEKAGIAAKSVREQAQPSIFIVPERFNPFRREEQAKASPRDPRVRFELVFPKEVGAAALHAWIAAFDAELKEQGTEVQARLVARKDGKTSFVVQRTDLTKSLDRVYEALGDKFGLYATPSDVLFLSDDPDFKKGNPRLDMSKLTKLKGTAQVENVLGLMLGNARLGGIKGSASRIVSYTGYRERYMSDFLVAQDSAEQQINFFSGHAVHAANGWLVAQLHEGRRPTPDQYADHLRTAWAAGIREFKPVGIPANQKMERLLRASVTRGLQMYEQVLQAHDRGEVLVGTEIPNFMVIEDYKRGADGKLKGRFIVHTIFDFVALRPNPARPGHATLVIYDFKTGPAKSRQKLEDDDQVKTYSLFAYERWVGKRFPVPYLSGTKSYVIDDAAIEWIYNLKQTPTITSYAREKQRGRIIRVLKAIDATERKLLMVTATGRPSASAQPRKKPTKRKRK